jgi:hypothetical protein
MLRVLMGPVAQSPWADAWGGRIRRDDRAFPAGSFVQKRTGFAEAPSSYPFRVAWRLCRNRGVSAGCLAVSAGPVAGVSRGASSSAG